MFIYTKSTKTLVSFFQALEGPDGNGKGNAGALYRNRGV